MAPSSSSSTGSAQTAGATVAGLLEIGLFHPFDTASKRLMSHQHRVVDGGARQTLRNVDAVLFGRLPEPRTAAARAAHMYPGSRWAVAYKVSQRVVKFAGQPVVKDACQRSGLAGRITDTAGPKAGKVLVEMAAGVTVGCCEIVLLPLDRMKVLSQTNAGSIAGRPFLTILRQEGVATMYAGAATTAARNSLGSALLFGGTAVTKDVVFGLEDYRSATFLQNTVSSTIGACLGVFFTSPADVIKTRIQNKCFSQRGEVSGLRILREVLRTEGMAAFYKGITPKIITAAPKLVFSFTMTEYIAKAIRHS